MQGIFIFITVLVAATAQEFVHLNQLNVNYPYQFPEVYIEDPQLSPEFAEHPHNIRFRRDVNLNADGLTVDKTYGSDRLFGTLGSSDAGLYGRAGVERNFFDDARGRLDGQLHGTRTLGPNPSSDIAGALNWRNNNAAASLDVSKQIHGPTNWVAAGGGRWPVGRNGEIGLDGTLGRIGGIRNVGAQGIFNYRF